MKKLKINVVVPVIILIAAISIGYFIVQNENTGASKTDDKSFGDLENELRDLSKELKRAEGAGDADKVKEISAEIDRKIPPPMKKFIEAVESQAYDIDFYGQVVDQNNKPVVGAKIEYVVNYRLNSGKTTRGAIETDQSGMFNIEAAGYRVSLKMPAHPNLSNKFIPGSSNKLFLSGQSVLLEPEGFGDEIHSWQNYNKNNPYTIRAWRIDKFENVLHGQTLLGPTPDGEVYTFLKTKEYKLMIAKEGINQKGHLLVSCFRDPNGYENKNGAWKVTIKAINGGIQETNDHYLYLAPTDGYQEALQIEMGANEKYGASVLKNKKYYYTAHNGQVFGGIKVDFNPYLKKRYCGLYVDYVVNTNSSRNLAVPSQ